MRIFKRWRSRFLAAGILLGLTAPVLANPEGPTVQNGQVTITPGAQTEIQQLTDRAIVDWQSFSIGLGESVRFLQPSELSVILNRVTGGDPSRILGDLQANGNVWLINPHGILFGPNSTVNVGGLVASTLNLTDEDFLAGNYNFLQDPNQDLAAVVNQGTITVTDGGYAVLSAPGVINEGTIVARAGNVVLASGERSTLNLDGRDLIHYTLGSHVSDGPVLLAPGMMSEAIAQTLGVEGSRRADKLVQMPDGSVQLVSSSGTLIQAGTVSADGRDNTDAGSVVLDSTDYTLLAAGSVTSASGKGQNSSAGDVLVLSDMEGVDPGLTTVQEGATVAAAGGESGDAGFIEVSGNVVQLRGDVDLTRTDGRPGSFLLDPGDVILVDDLNFVDPMDGNTYVTDLDIEQMLNMDAFVTVMADGQTIQSNITASSIAEGGTDTGIQAPMSSDGHLFLNAAAPGTSVDLGVDEFDWTGDFTITSTTDTNINASTILINGEFTANAVGGSITGDGFFIDTRNLVETEGDGGGIHFFASDSITLANATMYYDTSGAATINMDTTNGDISITDSLIESDYVIPNPPVRNYISGAIFASGRDIILQETDIFAEDIDFSATGSIQQIVTGDSQWYATLTFTGTAGDTFTGVDIETGSSLDISANTVNLAGASLVSNNITLDASSPGGSVDITDAAIRTDQRPTNTPSISIVSDQTIQGNPNSTAGLHSADIELTSVNGDVTATIDTSLDGNPGDSVPTNLSVSAGGGSTIHDNADPNDAQGINLTRFGPGLTAVSSGSGGISITSSGKIGLGTGDGVTTGDSGPPIVQAGTDVSLVSVDKIVDQTSTAGSSGGVEIQAGGKVKLEAPNGIGSFISNGEIDVDTQDLTVKAVALDAPIHVVSNEDLSFIDVVFNSGEVLVQDTGGGTLEHSQIGGSGPEVLRMNQGGFTLPAGVVRVTALSDVLVDGFDVNDGQLAIINAVNDSSILNGDPAGGPNITVGTAGSGTGGFVKLQAEGDVGSSTDPLTVQLGDNSEISAQGPNPSNPGDNLYLDLSLIPSATGPVRLNGLDQEFLTQPLDSLPMTPAEVAVEVSGQAVIDVIGDLFLPFGISADETALEATGSIELGQGASGSTALVIIADELIGAGSHLDGGAIGLDLDTDLGSAASPVDINTSSSLTVGATPGTSYFLRTNMKTGSDVAWVDSVTAGGKTVSGNQANILHHEQITDNVFINGNVTADEILINASDTTNPGSVEVNAVLNGTTRLEVQATGDITQGSSSGSLNSSDGIGTVVLNAGGNIGAVDNDQMVSTELLAAHAGGDAYIRDISGVTIVDDAAVPSGNGADGDFRVRSDNGDLSVQADITADELALVTGSDLTFPAQTIPPSILISGSLTANKMVLLSAGDIGGNGIITAGDLGLGATGAVGTTESPFSFTATNLALNAGSSVVNPTDPAPTNVASVSAAGVTVNAQQGPGPGPNPEPGEDGVIGVDVVLNPAAQGGRDGGGGQGQGQFLEDRNIDPNVFAQDNVNLVEDDLRRILELDSILDTLVDPTAPPAGWWNDKDLLRHKFRRKGK